MEESVLQIKKPLTLGKWSLFALLSAYYILFSYTWQELLFTDTVYYNTFAEQISMERIERYIHIQRKIQWIAYSIMPLVILFKASLVAICLNVGTLFANYKVKFGQLLKIVFMAEGVFVIASFIRVMWLYFVVQPTDMMQIKGFYPLSLLTLVGADVEKYLLYPLQTLNAFEITYWFVLASGLSRLLGEKYGKSFALVMTSYGIGVLLWGLFITFLSVNFS